jgi:beta-lactam-binding protein with PASTA domain
MSDKSRFYNNKKFYLALAVFIAACILFLFFLNTFIMPAYTHHDEGVTVPNVTRLPLKHAKKLLASSGLKYEVYEKRSNDAFPAHYVVEQNPNPSQIVKPGRKVYLAVNVISHPTVRMPELKNLSLRNARIQLENSNLKIGTISYEPGRFKNTVLHQSVQPKKIVKKGSEVDLVVSNGLGKQRVAVPHIIGIPLTKAVQKVRESGLRTGQIHYKPNSKAAPNTVLNYYPKVKETVVGSTLQLVVSELPGTSHPDTIFQNRPRTLPDTSDTLQSNHF